jgi:hypothetical protein
MGNILASNTYKLIRYYRENQNFGLMDIQTNEYSDQWIFGLMRCPGFCTGVCVF